MSHSWYFAATLPSLVFGAPAPLPFDDFLSRCKQHLALEEYESLVALPSLLAQPENPLEKNGQDARIRPFLSQYILWERSFRNALVVLRAREKGLDPSAWLKANASASLAQETTVESDAERAAATCFQASDPLAAETAYEHERWKYIETLLPFQSFDIDFLFGYALKLAIAERLASLDQSRGREGYERLYNDILAGTGEPAQSGVVS